MNTITVSASSQYDILVGQGLLDTLGPRLTELSAASKLAIISDSNVWPLYGQRVVSALAEAGFGDVVHYILPAGEQSKNGHVLLQVLEFLAENGLSRSDCIIALGGGVVGDLAGFAAAVFLRGIPYVQVPTTLLAAVDSSVGGKTAIDLSWGKNLAGAFYQPKLVLCDTDVLSTLPAPVFQDGCAEVIKYAVLYDQALFETLCQHGPNFDREQIISRCVELKRNVVAEDEFDRGARQMLNLGHTIGHGVEASSNFAVSHGQAVAIGMAIVARACAKTGICSQETAGSIIRLLQAFGLPTLTQFDAQTIYRCALNDKKRSGGTVNLIVPQAIGDCRILPTPVEELKAFIEAGL